MIVPGSASPLLTTTDGAYSIAKSLRFRSSASAYLNRTMSATGSQQKATFSAWVKKGTIGAYGTLFSFTASSENVIIYMDDSVNELGITTATYYAYTSAVFRDPSAWYHVVVSIDTTQATAANRFIIYVNGVQQAIGSSNYPPQNTNIGMNQNTYVNNIGRRANVTDRYFDGYMSDVNFIDGQQLTPSSFGETDSLTGVWKPKAYSGTYGTNGFYLKFTDVATTSGSNAGLGKDFSGNGNYWTTNNISVTAGSTYDSMTDVPTLTSATAANYCVINPVSNIGNGTISAGNLNYTSADWRSAAGTVFPSTGKWYFEVTLASFGTSWMAGVCNTSFNSWATYSGASTNAWVIQGTSGGSGKWSAGSSSTLVSGEVSATGQVYGFAYDADNAKLWVSKDNTWYSSGDPSAGTNPLFTGITGQCTPSVSTNSTGDILALNCGQRPFSYTPPTGYKALNTYNLPTSTIVAGNKYMDVTTWAGNSSSRSITNAGAFKPDFVWIKDRTSATPWHQLQDSVRGATKQLFSNATDAENTDTTKLTSFDTSGFSLGTSGAVNATGDNYVGWQWQAGAGSSSSNTNGSITSTVSVNPTAGFSVVTFNNPTSGSYTVGHGLGVVPQFIIIKYRSGTSNWFIYHTSLGYTQSIPLNTTAAANAVSYWTSAPSSTTVNFGSAFSDNPSQSLVMYCWAAIPGFSAFGSYTGNGSTDGPFVYTGFRPKYVLIKRTDTTADWAVCDSTRNPYNKVTAILFPNSSAAEATADIFQFFSNGFKLNQTGGGANASGGTYIYAAFAESPFKVSLAR